MRRELQRLFYSRLAIAIPMLILFASCQAQKIARLQEKVKDSNCNLIGHKPYTAEDLPQTLTTNDIELSLQNHFSPKSIFIANAMGILPLLEEYIVHVDSANTSSNIEYKLLKIEAYQKILHKINITNLEISSYASIMDCEEERAEQIASSLQDIDAKRETFLTVSAIVIGALGSVLTIAFIDQGNTNDYIGFGTGIIEATLGFMILKKGKSIDFNHLDNPLTDIWNQPKVSTYYPPSIWFFLTDSNSFGAPNMSMASELANRWADFSELNNHENISTKELLFGSGGAYNADDLELRASMLDQLESTINLMKQDLEVLSQELLNID
ncbi:hypothetical protein [Aureibacter tunicatorum]|uniref:Uncharacterized protein n=1 Tax=Aureibacter tunicatorum TaxID=866807 RepID=A0AAE4BTG1_9BACT|nr:hypothetical protein [Aureibacter tunicatorum]MDR6239547.1 hypothetical protein [Aureibacter tunicatorum]BDD04024.1 hypothetical protein AUTU_15070 [Aureibacter tunicatorum]